MQYSLLDTLLTSSPISEGGETVTLSRELFNSILISALKSKELFDEDFYLSNNADVRAAIRAGSIGSGAEHYFWTGYFEGRMPQRFIVDERFYLENNPDVADAIKRSLVQTAQEHFEFRGFKEGRAPYRDFSLF